MLTKEDYECLSQLKVGHAGVKVYPIIKNIENVDEFITVHILLKQANINITFKNRVIRIKWGEEWREQLRKEIAARKTKRGLE